MDFWEARPTGRLLRYDPASGQTTVALDSLDFANGVAVGPAGEYVLVNETMTSRVHRLWLTGPRAGVREIFVEGLPGAPDNIAWDGQGIFWIGLFAPRTAAAERVRTLPPFWRKVLYRIPEWLRGNPVTQYGMVVGIDTTGPVRYNLQDPTGRFHSTTGALRVGETLFVSTLSRLNQSLASSRYLILSPSPLTPAFSSNTCFAKNGIKEPWEPSVDGIVVLRGYAHYLVMFADQAEKRSGGVKYGTTISFETMHRDYHESTCPAAWLTHNRRK